jgi:predicted alpha/beta superfamily hydrolase
MLFQMSDHQEGIHVDNRYALNKAWSEMWGHHVGGKFAYFHI